LHSLVLTGIGLLICYGFLIAAFILGSIWIVVIGLITSFAFVFWADWFLVPFREVGKQSYTLADCLTLAEALRLLKIVTLISLVALVTCFGLLAKTYWEIYSFTGWKEQVFTYATQSGSKQALSDFQKGKLQLYELNGEREKSEYSGRHDGQFEIWYKWYYPTLGVASRYGDAEYVEYYNDKMKYMNAHPEKFRQVSNAATNILAKPSAH
jgi:hypothetical protein